MDTAERLRRYRRFLYEKGVRNTEKGAKLNEKTVKKERERNDKLTKTDRFAYRTRYFSDSGIIGTRRFVSDTYDRFFTSFTAKTKRSPSAYPASTGRIPSSG